MDPVTLTISKTIHMLFVIIVTKKIQIQEMPFQIMQSEMSCKETIVMITDQNGFETKPNQLSVPPWVSFNVKHPILLIYSKLCLHLLQCNFCLPAFDNKPLQLQRVDVDWWQVNCSCCQRRRWWWRLKLKLASPRQKC